MTSSHMMQRLSIPSRSFGSVNPSAADVLRSCKPYEDEIEEDNSIDESIELLFEKKKSAERPRDSYLIKFKPGM